LLVAGVVFLAWPAQLGGHLSLIVVSGHSMDGTYRSNDLLLVWPHSDYDVGEIVVYQVPKGEPASGLRVVHRIVEKKDGHFSTQGDNRPAIDIWRPGVTDVVGRPVLRLPAGGLVLRWLLSPIALALLCAVCVYLAIVNRDSEADETDAESTDREATDPVPTHVVVSVPEPAPVLLEDAPPLVQPYVVSLVACQTITPYGAKASAR
jgi:signal peptidase